jgi:hypothetical protein
MGHAKLRDPQVVVNGSGLRAYLDSWAESIDPATDQLVVELLASDLSNTSTFSFQVELGARSDASSIGIYNGHDAAPVLYEIFPAHARQGWFAYCSFGSNPVRVVVNAFDENAVLQSTRQYLGASRQGFGFYIAGPQGTSYSQDHRNAGGAAKVLFFKGNGVNEYAARLAFESQAALASDDDFDDAVLLVESSVVCLVHCGHYVTPVRRARWGEVKAWYR